MTARLPDDAQADFAQLSTCTRGKRAVILRGHASHSSNTHARALPANASFDRVSKGAAETYVSECDARGAPHAEEDTSGAWHQGLTHPSVLPQQDRDATMAQTVPASSVRQVELRQSVPFNFTKPQRGSAARVSASPGPGSARCRTVEAMEEGDEFTGGVRLAGKPPVNPKRSRTPPGMRDR